MSGVIVEPIGRNKDGLAKRNVRPGRRACYGFVYADCCHGEAHG